MSNKENKGLVASLMSGLRGLLPGGRGLQSGGFVYKSPIQAFNKEYCNDELSKQQNYFEEHDTDSNQVNDIRFYYDCK